VTREISTDDLALAERAAKSRRRGIHPRRLSFDEIRSAALYGLVHGAAPYDPSKGEWADDAWSCCHGQILVDFRESFTICFRRRKSHRRSITALNPTDPCQRPGRGPRGARA
jgi:hypothetical protein